MQSATPSPEAAQKMAPSATNGEAGATAPRSSAPQSGAQAPSRQGVHISPAAVEYAKKRLEQRGTPDAAVRVGVRGGGCSGFNYVIEFSDDPPRARDIVSKYDGVTFYVDKKSLLYLGGSTLDYTNSVMFQGFKFLNPQEATKCGCGHSFTVK